MRYNYQSQFEVHCSKPRHFSRPEMLEYTSQYNTVMWPLVFNCRIVACFSTNDRRGQRSRAHGHVNTHRG